MDKNRIKTGFLHQKAISTSIFDYSTTIQYKYTNEELVIDYYEINNSRILLRQYDKTKTIYIYRSEYYTFVENQDLELPSGLCLDPCYCLPISWWQTKKCPHQIWKVSDDSSIYQPKENKEI
jgi:hypothetical protein